MRKTKNPQQMRPIRKEKKVMPQTKKKTNEKKNREKRHQEKRVDGRV